MVFHCIQSKRKLKYSIVRHNNVWFFRYSNIHRYINEEKTIFKKNYKNWKSNKLHIFKVKKVWTIHDQIRYNMIWFYFTVLDANKVCNVVIDCVHDICKLWKDELPELCPPKQLLYACTHEIKNTRRKMEDRHVLLPDLNTLFDLKVGGHYYRR